MEYTITKLAVLSGVSTRTLRYYDEISLLKPLRTASNGYRIYGQKEVGLLQQILFFKELGFDLSQIKEIITNPAFDEKSALQNHLQSLMKKRTQLDELILTVQKTLSAKEGVIKMKDSEKFEGFKKEQLKENERQYGEELRKSFGEKTIKESDEKFKNMTQEQFEHAKILENEIKKCLGEALKQESPYGQMAQKACALHKEWLCIYWPSYSREAHMGLAKMYTEDERFRAYYDSIGSGCAELFEKAIIKYCN